jgi:hypothetical protein
MRLLLKLPATAILLHHVEDIVAMSAEEEVRRVYALTVVTRVADLHPLWDFPVRQSPGHAVSAIIFAAAHVDVSVPCRLARTHP